MSELDEIQEKYDRGDLDSIKEDLERFILAHRTGILECRVEQERKGNPLADDALIKYYFLRHRSINPRREITDQLDEIQKEKWIRGVNTGQSPDPQRVAEEWAHQHSAAWRNHRLNEIVFVFEKDKERYVRLLSQS
jgi:hypothetical protein